MSERTVVLSATSTTSAEGERCALPLRIAITVDPEIPVPPVLYGGIERIVDMLLKVVANLALGATGLHSLWVNLEHLLRLFPEIAEFFQAVFDSRVAEDQV